MAQIEIALLLLSLGSFQNQTEVQERLTELIHEKVDDIYYGDDGVFCNTEIELVDNHLTDDKNLIVDFEAMQDDRIHGCSARTWFCRAIFNKKEELKQLNCRD